MIEAIAKGGVRGVSIDLQVFEEQVLEDSVHAHKGYELVFIGRGSGRWQLGGEVTSFSAGFLGLTPADGLHRWESAERAGELERVSGMILRFGEESLPGGLLQLPEMKAVADLVAAAGKGLRFQVRDRDRLSTRLRSLQRASGALRFARFIVALELIAGFDRRQVLSGQGCASDRRVRSTARWLAVKRFLEREFRKPVSRQDAAKEAGMEVSAFSRFFREESGTTFVDYLASLRVRCAATLLGSRRDLSVSEVARQSGFRNESAFHRQFRKRLGTTPAEYRRAANSEVQAP